MDAQDNNNGQQPGDGTQPPVLDTPISPNYDNIDGAGAATPASGQQPTGDTDAGDYMMGDIPTASSDNSASDPTSFASNSHPADDDSAVAGQADDASANVTAPDELLTLKQQALQQLTPLVKHLDQTPEEEFRTTMMMIQAADNQSLLPKAYEAAQKITDEKTRAQALLDVVNEINYFTQHQQQGQQPDLLQ